MKIVHYVQIGLGCLVAGLVYYASQPGVPYAATASVGAAICTSALPALGVLSPSALTPKGSTT